ncbi:restriction endonuclease subunit S [Roseovarius sp. MBR-6]|uniref:restriction endonuclease subunit S n=1 Tax=Roseovarius sp. MBR-6 TaxID=3156459 RepID=UPI00339A0421
MSDFVPLADLCLKITKGTTPNAKDGGFADSGVNYIKSESLTYSGSIDATKFAFISEETNQRLKRSIIQNGDVLYSIAGANLGKCGIARRDHLPANTNQAVAIIRVDEQRASHRFISFCLRNPSFVQSVLGGVAQSAQPNVNLAEIGRFRIPNLPLPEQHAIAATLGALDDKIELNRKMNATLEAMARALFRDWFVNFGPTRAKMEGRTPYLSPYLSPDLWSLFPDRLDAEGKPEGWEVRPVGDFAELKGGKQLEKEHIADAGPVPVFGGAGLMGYTTNHNADGFVISVGRVGAYCGQFFSHRGKAWINNNASLIRPNAGVSGEWLLIALRHIDMDVIKKGAAQPFVSNGDIAKVGIVWPGDAIISAFSDALVSLIRKAEANKAESRTLAQTRDLLLPRLMSGELRVVEAERLTSEGT